MKDLVTSAGSYCKCFLTTATKRLRACLRGERVILALTHFLLFSSSCLQGSSGYPVSLVTLVGGLTFSLLNTRGGFNPPTQVNLLNVSRSLSATAQHVVPGCTVSLPVKFCL